MPTKPLFSTVKMLVDEDMANMAPVGSVEVPIKRNPVEEERVRDEANVAVPVNIAKFRQ